MKLQDVLISAGTRQLLETNGYLDAQKGISMHDGWEQIRAEAGYSSGRTPAREAYEDGWYSCPPEKRPAKPDISTHRFA